jgi:exopolyphosphatase / guanosine-5'-triphosphate,3'-diphosphate pyrophosphatase
MPPDVEALRPPEAAPRGDATVRVYAALDLGTNNCRLLVAEPAPDGFRVIESFSRIVRLGEGLGATGRLSPRAMGRAVQALRVCAVRLRRYPGVRLRSVATEACRRAANGRAFVERVFRETGLVLEIIDTEEEARLALAGCAALLDAPAPHALVFDIGGGSTELVWRRRRSNGAGGASGAGGAIGADTDDFEILSHSAPIGVVSMAERHGADRIAPATYARMVDDARRLFEPFEAAMGIGGEIAEGRVQMLGTSGTVTTLASVHLGLRRYSRHRVDGYHLDFDAIRALGDDIVRLGYRERAAMPCIGPQRADLVVGGIAILDAICGLWPVGRLRVADRGLREGILNGLIAADRARAGNGAAGSAA